MSFGQIVVGPPGSGKTSYCNGMAQFLRGLERNVILVNIDPANENIPYKPDIDIQELITVEDAEENFGLGPNGALMYCMETLEKNYTWLEESMSAFKDDSPYYIIDCPGQVELYTHHDSTKNIINLMLKAGYRLTCVNLIDSFYCSSPYTFISAVLLSLSSMLQLGLPHVNLLSKVDLIEKFGKLDSNLEFYTSGHDLERLVDIMSLEGPISTKMENLTRSLCGVISEFSLVRFWPLAIDDKDCMAVAIKQIDTANGYLYTTQSFYSLLNSVTNIEDLDSDSFIQTVQDKYMPNS